MPAVILTLVVLLGVVGGAIVGTFIGLRRAGSPASRGLVRGTATVVAGALLVAGSYPPSGVAAAAERAAARPPVAAGVHVATERASIRARPDASSDVTATVAPRTRLRVVQTSANGDWAYVETVDQSGRHGWVRRAALSDETVAMPHARVAGTPAPPTEPATHTYAADGEVQLAPTDPSATPPSPGAVDSAAPPPDSAPVPVTRRRATVGPPAGAGPVDTAARSVVADVRARLAEARDGAGAGDYAAALRALAAADESVALAAAAHGDATWVTALRRDVVSARGAVRAQCESSVALATRRGNPPPRCE